MLRLVLLALLVATAVEAMRKQGVAVRGRVLCGTSAGAANSTKVAIYDIDIGDPGKLNCYKRYSLVRRRVQNQKARGLARV